MRGDGVQVVDGTGHRVGWRRPVALPDDVDSPTIVKAHGLVWLPLRVSWSGVERPWNLDDPRQQLQVYEMVSDRRHR